MNFQTLHNHWQEFNDPTKNGKVLRNEYYRGTKGYYHSQMNYQTHFDVILDDKKSFLEKV